MKRYERIQMRLLAGLGIVVEASRKAQGAHKLLFCRGPQGQRFTVLLTPNQGDLRSLRNFEHDVRRAIRK